MYKSLPATYAIAKLLKPRKDSSRWTKGDRLLWIIIIAGAVVMAVCYTLIRWDWTAKRPTGYVALSSFSVTIIAWIATVLIDVVRTVPLFLKPDKELAAQFDRDAALETEMLVRFRAIPTAILLARHQRLEWQLSLWEKWLDVARLMGLLGPPLILVSRSLFDPLIPDMVPWHIEVFVSAALTGVLIGAISMRTGMKSLYRVSNLLKHAATTRGREIKVARATGREWKR